MRASLQAVLHCTASVVLTSLLLVWWSGDWVQRSPEVSRYCYPRGGRRTCSSSSDLTDDGLGGRTSDAWHGDEKYGLDTWSLLATGKWAEVPRSIWAIDPATNWSWLAKRKCILTDCSNAAADSAGTAVAVASVFGRESIAVARSQSVQMPFSTLPHLLKVPC